MSGDLGDTAHNQQEYVTEITKFRQDKDRYFGASDDSPIPHAERHTGFASLSYYPPDPAYRVRAEVAPFANPKVVRIATSTGELRPQQRYAELRFRLGDRDLTLTAFADPGVHHTHELFVPFRDTTSGTETYGAGRYLEVEVDHGPDGETATIDFNLAYNPYCAYSEFYSCPLPPPENTLPVPIPAGERSYGDGH